MPIQVNRRAQRNAPGIDRTFFEEVSRVIVAVRNLVDRSSPADLNAILGFTPFLLVLMHAAKTNYEAILFLSADSPSHHDRKLEFGVVTSPLIRFLVDLLFSLIFIRLKPRSRMKRYNRSGWRELQQALDRVESKYGTEAEWANTIGQRKAHLEELRQIYRISKRAAARPDSLPKWPIPSQILKDKKTKFPVRTRKFLEYLQDWFYKELSQDAHMSSAGTVRIYSKLLLEPDEGRELTLKTVKSINAMMAIALILAICSEVNDIGRFDRAERLAYLWGVVTQHRTDALQLFELRYRTMLRRRR